MAIAGSVFSACATRTFSRAALKDRSQRQYSQSAQLSKPQPSQPARSSKRRTSNAGTSAMIRLLTPRCRYPDHCNPSGGAIPTNASSPQTATLPFLHRGRCVRSAEATRPEKRQPVPRKQ
jgi:hypothetical protein